MNVIRNKRTGNGYIRNLNRGYSRYTGRPMKQDAGAHGSTPTPTGGNDSGDGGGTTQTPAGGDNAGPKFDPMEFWNSSAGEGDKTAPSGESTGKSTPPAGQQQQESQPQDPAASLAASIQSMKFAPVMNDAAIAELAEGKTDAFHAQLESFGRETVQHTIRSMIPILGTIRDQLREEFSSKMEGSFKSRDDSADLLKAIPSAANPAVRPMVDRIFERAMTLNKNDRTAAIAMTKDMLRLTSTTLGDDIGLPARSAGDNESLVPSKTNWLEELAGR